jgi:hypothetical protein
MRQIGKALFTLAIVISGTIATAQDGSGVLRRSIFCSDALCTNVTGELVEFCDGTFTMNGVFDVHGQVFEYGC